MENQKLSLKEQFDILSKRAHNCEDMYKSLGKQYPGWIHELNRSAFSVTWGYWRVKGWYKDITEDENKKWLETIEYHEKRLERIAKNIIERGTPLY